MTISFNNLKPYYQQFNLGRYETEYRAESDIILTVYSNGSCDITAGLGSNNLHGLQNEDLHKGKYKTPYFAYKCIPRFKTVKDAEWYFNKWLSQRKEG